MFGLDYSQIPPSEIGSGEKESASYIMINSWGGLE
jgi:hypothetical protein